MAEKVDGYNVQAITYRHKQADYVLRHKHTHYEIVYYFEGKGLTTVYGETVFNFKYSPDSIVIIPPDVYHDEYATEPTEIICNQLNISGEQPSTALFFKKTAHTAAVFDKIKSLMSRIALLWFAMEEGRGDTGAEIYELLGHLEIIVFKLIHSEKKSRSEYVTELIGIVKKYIHDYYLNKINYRILAEELGYSYDRFRHIFLENTGMTLHVYQQGFKLDYAKQKLIATDMKIYDLAVKCGFANSIRFCEWFKNLAGVSPQKFRTLNRSAYRWGVIMHYSERDAEKKPLFIGLGQMSDARIAATAVACALEKDGLADLRSLTAVADTENRLSATCARFGDRVPVAVGPDAVRQLADGLKKVPPRSAIVLFVGINALESVLRDSCAAVLLREKAETVILIDDQHTTALTSADLADLPVLFVDEKQTDALDDHIGADVVAVAYAVLGDGDMISTSKVGCVEVNSGRVTFAEGAGNHRAFIVRAAAKLREQLKILLQKTDRY